MGAAVTVTAAAEVGNAKEEGGGGNREEIYLVCSCPL